MGRIGSLNVWVCGDGEQVGEPKEVVLVEEEPWPLVNTVWGIQQGRGWESSTPDLTHLPSCDFLLVPYRG